MSCTSYALNTWSGTDLASVVVAVGDQMSDLRVGDEVFGTASAPRARDRAGAFAELIVAVAST